MLDFLEKSMYTPNVYFISKKTWIIEPNWEEFGK
jgi:hypothetical protein